MQLSADGFVGSDGVDAAAADHDEDPASTTAAWDTSTPASVYSLKCGGVRL